MPAALRANSDDVRGVAVRPAGRLFRALIVCLSGLLALLVVWFLRSTGRPAVHRRPPDLAARTQVAEGVRERTALPAAHRTIPVRAEQPPPATAEVARVADITDTPSTPRRTAKDDREEIMNQLHNSGVSNEPWTNGAAKVFHLLEARFDAEVKGRYGAIACFHDGCARVVTFSSVADAETALEKLRASEEFMRWPGVKTRTGTEILPSGEAQNSLILYRPENPAKTM